MRARLACWVGVRAGDQFYEIDGVAADTMQTDQAVDLLRGEPGSEVLVRMLRPGVDEPIEFRIERGQFQYINNRQFAHSRTAFKDAPDGSRRRHMIRLWNRSEGTTDLEGGA